MTTGEPASALLPTGGTFVVDCDGVLYLDETPIPGAAEVLQALAKRGFHLLFCTNNSARTPAHLVDKLQRVLGYEATEDQVITSAQVAAREVRNAGMTKAAFLGMEGVEEALRMEGIETTSGQAPAVVVGIDFSFDYPGLRRAADLVRGGALFVATNTDATYPVPGGLWPGAGTMVAAVAAAGGRPPDIVAGKPHPGMVALIRERAGPTDIVVVGDRPETDLLLARAGGWRSVAVLTGIIKDPSEIPAPCFPDFVLESVADLLEVVDPRPGHPG